MKWNNRKRPAEERFWEKVQKTETCWFWTGYKRWFGYGMFGAECGKTIQAHRFSWELHIGKIPDGMYVCHHCDNPSCVNPQHLFLGTQLDNMRDCIRKNRFNAPKGEKCHKARLNELQVRVIRKLFGEINDFAIADIFGVSRGAVQGIKHNRTWKCVPKI